MSGKVVPKDFRLLYLRRILKAKVRKQSRTFQGKSTKHGRVQERGMFEELWLSCADLGCENIQMQDWRSSRRVFHAMLKT